MIGSRIKLYALVTAIFCLGLLLKTSEAAWADRYSYLGDGSEVQDSKTGLVWQRCVAGMSWNGATCTGTATRYTHYEALTYAKSQTGWSLPSRDELVSIVDKNSRYPAIDTTVFPATPASYVWSATAEILPKFVNFQDGDVYETNPYNTCLVRLVRAGQ